MSVKAGQAHLDSPKGSRFACLEGDAAACAVHDSSDKTWRHLDFFQHQAYLHARVPRVSCPIHGCARSRLLGRDPKAASRCCLRPLLMAMLAEMPVKAVAELVVKLKIPPRSGGHTRVGREPSDGVATCD
jgi:transposase